MNITDCVRDALSNGITTPKEGVKWIEEKHNVKITSIQFSTAKFQINRSKNGTVSNDTLAIALLQVLITQYGVSTLLKLILKAEKELPS